MTKCPTELVPSASLLDRAGALQAPQARMQMAYAIWPEDDSFPTVRYVSNVFGSQAFNVWEVPTQGQSLPSLAKIWPLLGWYEREMMELSAIPFTDHPEPYRLVTAISPPKTAPLAPATRSSKQVALSATGLPTVSGRHVQLLPFGPVRADVMESAQFNFFYIGEGILHYHPELFIKHRGMEKRFEGTEPELAVLIAERVSGVDSVANAFAYCSALEDACHTEVPTRAQYVRVVLAELERIYNHLHYLGHLCHTTTLKVGEAEGKLLEERVKQINSQATGSRFLRGIVCPGGIRRDIDVNAVKVGIRELAPAFERYVDLVLRTSSHIDRLVSTAPLSRKLAFDQGATGPVERASGLDRDLRRDHPYGAYAHLTTRVSAYPEGDAFARMKVRIGEVRASVALLEQALDRMPRDSERQAPVSGKPGATGMGWAEATRGTLLYAVHIAQSGRLHRVKIKSPSFSNWRVFPFTVHDSNMMDYAINEASFGLTVAECAR